MVLKVSLKEVTESEPIPVNPSHRRQLFTVVVDSYKILAVLTTGASDVAAEWFSEVLRWKVSNTRRVTPSSYPENSIFVGMVMDERSPVFGPRPYDPINNGVDLVTLCIGSHSIILELKPEEETPKKLRCFLEDPRVLCIGTDMVATAKKLEKRFQIKLNHGVDLNQLAEKACNRPDLDLGRYNFEKLVMTVLGKSFDVVRPSQVPWFEAECASARISGEKILESTVDSYLRLTLFFKLKEALDGGAAVSCSNSEDTPKTERTSKKMEKSPKPGRSHAELMIKAHEDGGYDEAGSI